MKKYIYRILLLFPLGVFFLLVSCNKLDQSPTNNFTDDNFWVSPEKAQLILNMAYSQMYSADKMFSDENLGDNLFQGRGSTDQRTIRNGQATPALGIFSDTWLNIYQGLKTCNIFLDKIDLVPNMDAARKSRMIAEIRFIRAFQFFRLTNFYGDVPFFTKDISLEESRRISRTPYATVRKFIHDELEAIVNDLPSRNNLPANENGRLTKGAAIAMNARAYLYEGNYGQVKLNCEKLINEQSVYGNYSLFSSYAGLFMPQNENNAEVILDVQYVPLLRTWSNLNYMAPISVGSPLNGSAPTQSLVDNYITINGLGIDADPDYDINNPYNESLRDPRLKATVVYDGFNWQKPDGTFTTIRIKPGSGTVDEYRTSSSNVTSTGYYTRKYYDPTSEAAFVSGLNIIMLRYADVLLMYAEAKQELGEMDQSVWNKTIRPIRQRAGFSSGAALDFPTSSSSLKDIIRRERRSELALEGLRYFDIIRWKEGPKYLSGYVYGARFANNNTENIQLDYRVFNEQRDYLWSLPLDQMNLNANLRPNNPGYSF
ncbi:RagB/SusD family nutrient uptake outer membrane protein [Pseudopedobacter beijingensis]|uniref:RagB/SusD family nutrient uptake outer membrane protein n=1 Tax=Pseudopedobacter beijingensis TaxID=1207056 RepID=A0ABW4IDJ4_9SPHI